MGKILNIVTNQGTFGDTDKPTGLWLGELTHFYDLLEAHGYEQDIASPAGGRSPLEPRSLGRFTADRAVRRRLEDPAFMARLENTLHAENLTWSDYDAIYFTGGHGTMWDFRDDPHLQRLARDMFENGRIVSSVCHGYTALADLRLTDGEYLVKDKRMTGFSWTEEIVAGVAKKVPYNVEEIVKQQGARYEKARLPLKSFTVRDGNLITGQNPGSARAVAADVLDALTGK
ncbi:putative intracellular protease/amidase [Catenulispora sp. GAS73]|uniref:type 1 glutamine amidotransferase domain-containing protein n=1 Tax=Catenulispora sp. GAS73 TaxID=3156269 RepID=UPI003511F86D